MNFLRCGILFLMICVQSMPRLDAHPICSPDQSIKNQKAKQISQEAQTLLVKVMKDKISLQWPVEVCKCWVSSLFGPRGSSFHNGVDFAAQQGTPVFAAADGIVEVAQKSLDKNGYGNMILLHHDSTTFLDELGDTLHYKSRYAHLHDIFVQQGDTVIQGQKIGTVGATGHVITKHPKSDPSHLHFELYRGDKRINPLLALFAMDSVWVKKQRV